MKNTVQCSISREGKEGRERGAPVPDFMLALPGMQ